MTPPRLSARAAGARAAPTRAILVVAGLAVTLTGCRAFQPDPCREQRPNVFQRVGRWVTHKDKALRGPSALRADDCEPGLIGVPMSDDCGVLGGGAPVITAPTDGIIGADAPPLDMSPVITSPPSGAAPNPTGSIQSGSLQSNANGAAKPDKAVYESYRPRDGVATARRDGASASPPPAADPLANLPKLETPAELSPVPPEAETVPDPGTASAPADLSTPPMPAAASSSAPGIRSFSVVEPRLAGGSLPAERGWEWLAEQGYRTVLDLRPLDQLRSEDLAAVNSSGLRYVALPTADEMVENPAHLARFAAEIGQDSARPLYFFDRDGSRAAVLWYLHQVVNRKAPADTAARAADEIGPRDPALWTRAARVVEKLKPVEPAPAVAPADPGPVPEPTPAESKPADAKPAAPASSPTALAPRPPLGPPDRVDPTAWKPYATLAAAGLGVPLAFLGRGVIARAIPRASLPAPARSVRAIAASSGD